MKLQYFMQIINLLLFYNLLFYSVNFNITQYIMYFHCCVKY